MSPSTRLGLLSLPYICVCKDFGSSRTSKHTLLEIDDNCLLHNGGSSLFERLMRRVVFYIIISFVFRREPENKGMAKPILVRVRSLCGHRCEMTGTCRPSTDVSIPPVIDNIYGRRVSGWTQDFFKPKNLDVICTVFSFDIRPCTRSGARYLFDRETSGRFLELEQNNVRGVRYQWSVAAKEIHRPLHN